MFVDDLATFEKVVEGSLERGRLARQGLEGLAGCPYLRVEGSRQRLIP
jgi:hypothetical protein